jgi:hypothetical protein
MSPRVLFAAGTWLLTGVAAAAPIALNEEGLARGFALPAMGQLSLAEPGHLAQQFDLDLINEFFLGTSSREYLETDAEAQRLAWRGSYGIAPGWEVGLNVPLYFTNGGFLDGSIEGWHRFFGLPNANRADRAHNRIIYKYVRDGRTLLDIQDSATGIGDVRLQAGRALSEYAALRAQIKLPTGSSSKLLGNGAWGAATWIDLALPFDVASRLDGFLSAGLSYTGTGDVLSEVQKNFVPFGAAGLSCRLFAELSAVAQFGIHGPLYEESNMAPLERIGAPLSFGLNYRFSPQTELEVLIQEDSSIYASPDFVLHFALSLL